MAPGCCTAAEVLLAVAALISWVSIAAHLPSVEIDEKAAAKRSPLFVMKTNLFLHALPLDFLVWASATIKNRQA